MKNKNYSKNLLQELRFTCGDENLFLGEIINTKKIISLKVLYLKQREKKIKSLGKLFKIKVVPQEVMDLTIRDQKGISFNFFPENEALVIRFWEEKEFKKLDGKDYDPETIFRRYIFTLIQPFEITFHIRNLKELEWVDKD